MNGKHQMPLKKLEKPGFYYIAYCRRDIDDFVEFKMTLDGLSKKDTLDRDIIVDLTKDENITDGEFTVLGNVLKKFRTSRRFLRIVLNDTIKPKFDSADIFKTGNVELYSNHMMLFEALSRSQTVTSSEQEHAETRRS
jgi:hypothetical protein